MTQKPKTAMDEVTTEGAFVRSEATFRNWIKKGSTEFPPEAGRYHLYVSYACPWASRTLVLRALKGLEDAIGVTVVHPVMTRTRPDDPDDLHHGWHIYADEAFPECKPDDVRGFKTVREIYDSCGGASKYSVPVLYDTMSSRIVNNESSEIIRMLNSEFNDVAKHPGVDLYPEHLRAQIDEFNDVVLRYNNGVYRAGFATAQRPYDDAVAEVFATLDKLEDHLSHSRYLCGNTGVTLADVRLFVTLVRHDEVYHGHFKCNKKRISDYPNLENYTRDMYQLPGVKYTVQMKHIKHHYYRSHPTINKYGIVATGPGVDYALPHDRDRFSRRQSLRGIHI